MVDGGGLSPPYNQQGEIKFEVLLESFRQMKYDAISIGAREILMQRDNYNAWEKLNNSGIPIATLNISYRGKGLSDKPLIIHRGGVRVGVFSLFIDGHIPKSAQKDWYVEDPEKIIDATLSYARKNADFVVAMLHGNIPQSRKFVKNHKGMDIVIVSHSSIKLKKPEKVNSSLLVCAGSQGKYLGRIDAHLSGGKWRFNTRLIALDRTVPGNPLLTKTYARYLERIERMAKKKAQKREEELAGKFPPVLRATACQSCHKDIYHKWVKTPHTHAIDSLIKKKEHHDPECISCHVTYYLKGGFVSREKTPEYAGVQCVSCHGRMEGHIEFHSGKSEKQDAPPQIKRDICLKCHMPERDDDFDFERDKKMVH
ncbi:MAG: hypothetical protein JRI46_06475 [Deltaproteobacteria bacterium]|nr:hypothetical protein [Deltaproteobacteria bacterium]